jgi:succinate dehydrogenase/fumarate reductase flavoprotein subunit
MDFSSIPEEKVERFRTALPIGWSEEDRALIVSPTTHFCMGGIITNEDAATSVPGLFAAGEVCAGMHGANRLGGNALSEVFAMGSVAGRNGAKASMEMGPAEIPQDAQAQEKARLSELVSHSGRDLKSFRYAVKSSMWLKAGIVRNGKDLIEALCQIEDLKEARPSVTNPGELIRYLEFRNMLLLSEMVCRAALLRTESRGSHYRTDYSGEDNETWLKNIVIRKDGARMELECVPVSLELVSP